MAKRKSLAQVFAQEAIRGFFNDSDGFTDMNAGARKASTNKVTKLLNNVNLRKCGHWSQWLALALTLKE